MGFRMIALEQLPLGQRILQCGDRGRDVGELQRLLREAGFYFGPGDGEYGPLTEEAVILFQKAFGLNGDGRAGRKVWKLLMQNTARNPERIIHVFQKPERLKELSYTYGVTPNAWQRLPGQRGFRHYQGMKLLLHQKALLIWDENKHQKPAAIHHTGVVITRWLIDPEGHLHPQDNADPDHNEYSLLAASSENWGRILDHPSVWRTIAANLQPHPAGRLGIDLRDAPPASTPVWEAFLKELSRTLRRNKFDLLVLPISSQQKRFIRSFWRNLPLLSRYAHRIALEPALDLSSSERCLASPRLLPIAKKLQAINLASKCLWVTDTAGWDWNLTQSRPAKISYKEAKILRAALTGPALNYDPKLQLIRGGFQKHQENHILIYRDLTGWTAWLRLMARSGLHGVIVRNFGDLGKAGPALLAESFAILPAESDQAT